MASYLFHAYGTNLQFAPGEFNFVKTRAEHGTSEAFRLRDEHSRYPNRTENPPSVAIQYLLVCKAVDASIPRWIMPEPVIVGAVRTAIGRSFKGTLVNTPPETLITAIVPEVIRRAVSTPPTSTT